MNPCSRQFELALWDPISDAPISQSIFLQRWRKGLIPQLPSCNNSSFLLRKGEIEYVGSAWNLGRIDWMIRQIDAARQRLQKGCHALIRSAVEDQQYPPFFLFEPQVGQILISCFHIWTQPHCWYFPIKLFSANDPTPEALYAFVERQQDSLLTNLGPDNFARIPFERETFLQDLNDEIRQSRQLLTILDVPGE